LTERESSKDRGFIPLRVIGKFELHEGDEVKGVIDQ
jgi:hypothetical protein